jgi:hypothetical protein
MRVEVRPSVASAGSDIAVPAMAMRIGRGMGILMRVAMRMGIVMRMKMRIVSTG